MEGDAQGIDLVRLLVFPVVRLPGGLRGAVVAAGPQVAGRTRARARRRTRRGAGQLWAITTLPREITSLPPDAPVGEPARQRLNAAIVDWYTAGGGALYLSWHATQRVFDLLDGLRSAETREEKLRRRDEELEATTRELEMR